MSHRRTVEELLEMCLTRPEEGRAQVERLLAEHPDQADEVRRLLNGVAGLQAGRPPMEPRAEFARRLWLRLQARPAAVRTRRPAFALRTLPALLAAVLVAAIGLGSIGIARASAAALPGDELYAVKRGVEDLRLALAWTPAADAQLLGEFADERLAEVQSLADAGRMDDLGTALDGYAEAVGRLAQAVDVPAAGGTDAVLEKLTYHIAVLEDLQSRLPAPAQDAIERVIERSIDAETTGRPEGPTPAPGEVVCPADQPDCAPAILGAGSDDRMTQQIAKIYNVSPDQVRTIYNGVCRGDWKCVRAHFREEAPRNPHRP